MNISIINIYFNEEYQRRLRIEFKSKPIGQEDGLGFLKYLKFLRRTTRANALKALAVLMICLALSFLVTLNAKHNSEEEASRIFKLICTDLKAKLQVRLQVHAQLLQNGAAYFEASDTVTRQEWKQFYEHSKIKSNLPGMQAFGYSMIIPPTRMLEHIKKIRREGFPDYSIKPSGERGFYTSIIYLEPFEGRNLLVFGYDMATEPTRRRALEIARDSDMVMLSDKVSLLQETEKVKQAGLLMYAPVYSGNLSLNTVQQRRKAIKGWVYSAYRMDDLMKGILGRWDTDISERIHLQVYEGVSISKNRLLYDSQQNKKQVKPALSSRSVCLMVDFNGKKILLQFTQTDGLYHPLQDQVPIFVASGIAISLLMFVLSLLVLNTHYRTQLIAEQLRRELEESESRFKIMFMQHKSIMLLINPENGNIIDANISASLFYCYPIPELCEMNTKDIDVQTDEERDLDRLKATELKRNFYISRHKLATGEIRLIEDYSSPIEYKGKTTIFSIVHDITDRQHAEQALKDSEERWKFAIEGANDGLWDWNMKTGEVYFSPRWKAMLGYEPDEINGTFDEWETRIHPDDKNKTIDSITAHIGGKTAQFSNIHRLLCKDGVYKWILDRGKIISYDTDGKAARMIGTHTDMTERMEMEKRLIQVNADKDRFIYILAHDLKNPFNAILGFLEMLVEGVRRYNIDETERYVAAAHQSTLHAYHLLHDLLSWSQSQANRLPFRPRTINLEEVYTEIADLLKLSASKKNISIHHRFPSDIYVFADKNMLGTIFRNLITNAIKFTHPGGMITIDAVESSSGLTVSITDTGIGIKAESLEKLFDISHLHTTEGTAKEMGTGFGLFLCKDFMEKHGGAIHVESESGKGSKFSLCFPKGQ